MKTPILMTTLAAGISLLAVAETTRSEYFSGWPQGAAPAEVGKRVAENFLARKLHYETLSDRAVQDVIYSEVITWSGSLTLAQLTKDQELTDRLVKKFEFYLSEPGLRKINPAAHVDHRVFGALPLEIFIQTKDPRCKSLGLSLADAQWEPPTPGGITAEARYWIDDMYMIPIHRHPTGC